MLKNASPQRHRIDVLRCYKRRVALVSVLLRDTAMRVRSFLLMVSTLLLLTVAVAEARSDGLRLPEQAWLVLFGVALLGVGRVARHIASRRHER